MSKACETLPCSSDFHDTYRPAIFHFIAKQIFEKKIYWDICPSWETKKIKLTGSFLISGSISNVFNAEFLGNLLTLGASINGNDLKASGVRCSANYKDWTVGVELSANNITSPNFILSPTPNLTVETDLSKVNIGYLLVSLNFNFETFISYKGSKKWPRILQKPVFTNKHKSKARFVFRSAPKICPVAKSRSNRIILFFRSV